MQDDEIAEKFFDVKQIRKNTEGFSGNGAIKQNIVGETAEHQSLLEIQTMLFNNVIRNNPKKYSRYISVNDIPKGAPIEILDTVCVGDNMTGNEDSDECLANGGQLVKIKNKTTKIKLELLPEDDTVLDAVDEKELYFHKESKKLPDSTVPSVIQNYNSSLNSSSANRQIIVPQTTGITYNIGATSSNDINANPSITQGFNPQPTQKISIPAKDIVSNASPVITDSITMDTHPAIFDESVVQKCKTDAIKNSNKITEAMTTTANTTPQTTFMSKDISSSGISNTTIIIATITLILFMLICGYLIYSYYSASSMI